MPPAKRRDGDRSRVVWCLPRIVGRGLDPAAHWFGGRERPPYRAPETVGFPVTPAWRIPLPGGIVASPTNTRYRVHEPETGQRRKHARAACMRPLRTGRKRQGNGQSRRLSQPSTAGVNARPTGRRERQARRLPWHGRNTQKPDTNCTFVQCRISPGVGPKLHAAPCKMPCRRARRRLHKNFFGRPP